MFVPYKWPIVTLWYVGRTDWTGRHQPACNSSPRNQSSFDVFMEKSWLWRSRIALTPSTMSTWIENSDEVTKYVLYFSDLFCFIWRHGYQATSFEYSQGLGCFRVPMAFCFLQDICFVLRQAITFFFLGWLLGAHIPSFECASIDVSLPVRSSIVFFNRSLSPNLRRHRSVLRENARMANRQSVWVLLAAVVAKGRKGLTWSTGCEKVPTKQPKSCQGGGGFALFVVFWRKRMRVGQL